MPTDIVSTKLVFQLAHGCNRKVFSRSKQEQLEEWLKQNPGNVAISCNGNSLRLIRRVFERLSLKQLLKIETPQDQAMTYALQIQDFTFENSKNITAKAKWQGTIVPKHEILLI